jgi:DNA repair protein SbcD/Mre11
MKRLRFIHAADLHFDSPFKGMSGMPERLREQVRESTFDSLRGMVQLALRERVDFVVISGDVYDLADRSLRAQIRFQKAAQQLAASNIPTLIIHGNHDPEDGRAAKLNWPAAVHFFASDRVEAVPVEKPGRGVIAQVHGISYGSAAVTDNLALLFKRGELDVYQIGMLHTNVDVDPGHSNYAPCSKQDLLASGMHYWALGHVHTRKVLNVDPAIVYPGNVQGRSVRETGPRGCYIVDVDEDGRAELTFHALDSLRWFHEQVSVAGVQTEQELRDLLEQHVERIRTEAAGRGAIARLRLEGRGPVHRLLRKGRALEELLAELREEEVHRLGEWEERPTRKSAVQELSERVSESNVVGSAASWNEPRAGAQELDELGSETDGEWHKRAAMARWSELGSETDGELHKRAAGVGATASWNELGGGEGEGDGGGFVWVESIEDRSGSEIDLEALQQQNGFAGDLLRLSQSLLRDDAALRTFAGEALAALQSLPQAAGTAAAETERLQQWLRAAEELAADLLAADGGWDG